MAKAKKVVEVVIPKAIATLSIRGAKDMTVTERKEVAVWMKEEAKKLVKFGKDYSNRFTARKY